MVSLIKKQTISLTKSAANGLNEISIGLGWDPIKKSGCFFRRLFGCATPVEIDLDASCVLFDDRANQLDVVWFSKLKSTCGAVRHRGDNTTGDGEGDDEIIDINLSSLPLHVTSIAVTVNSFRGQTFNSVDNAVCRVLDVKDNNKELCRYQLKEQGEHTGIVIAALSRVGNEWIFTAHGVPCSGKTIQDMIPQIRQLLKPVG